MISRDEIANRLDQFIDDFEALDGLSFPLKVAFTQFAPKIPDLISNDATREDFFNFVRRLCFVMGYKCIFYAEDDSYFDDYNH